MARLDNHHSDRGLREERFRPLVDHSPDAICVFQDGRLVYINAAAVRCLGA
ncbi:MAG TPA: PAS domain-containing protein, partial [Mycobacterium sp.]|nr:PAS domain-containing protein [Mycobacterium sp.]